MLVSAAAGVVTALLVACRLAGAAYPLYSSKGRYSRSLAAWPPLPFYYPPRATRPVYYADTGYSDYYYPQDPYYYPVDKYPVYQSVLPSYYLDQSRPYYYGYDEVTEPVDDMQEDVTDEEMQGDTLPYGQETWFQDSGKAGDANAETNARFLQNLIFAQMYNEEKQKNPLYINERYPLREEKEGDRWVYGEPVKATKTKVMTKEDEDVRELKNLVRGPERMDTISATERKERSDKKQRKNKENIFAAQTMSNDWDEFSSKSYKRSNELKVSSRKSKAPASTPAPPVTPQPTAVRGQKEVVLPRPASPARHPDFLQNISVGVRSSGRDREPSVYDTIKKLLHMEEQLDEGETESRLQKRSYIPSEESLVAQLGGLKKMA